MSEKFYEHYDIEPLSNEPVENVVIENCHFSCACGGEVLEIYNNPRRLRCKNCLNDVGLVAHEDFPEDSPILE